MKTKNIFNQSLFMAGAILISGSAHAETKKRSTRVAVSQGISSPAVTTPVNFSHGFLYTNPAVAAELAGAHVSLEGASGNNNTGFGGELGVGSGAAGLSAGYFKNDCCKGRFGAIAGIGASSVSGGLGYHEAGTYSLGMIVMPNGAHRFGLAADIHSSGNENVSVGAGYSYHASALIFALDASRRDTGGGSTIMITPGLELVADIFALSVSYDFFAHEGRRRYNDQVWFGLGIGGDQVHFALYHDYVNDWSAALTFWM